MATKQALDMTCDADVVNKVEFNKRAREVSAARNSRTPEDVAKILSNRAQALSSAAGIASLTGIEGDWQTLNVYRDSPVLDFVEMRDMPLGSVPLYRTRSFYPVGVFQGSVNAMGITHRYATNDAGTQVFPFTVQTEEVEVPNLSYIYDMARLQQRQAALDRLAHDLQIALVNVNLNTMFGVTSNVVTYDPAQAIQDYYSGGGSFSGKAVFVLDPGVQTTSFPSTNVKNLSTEGGLTKHVFQALNDYRLMAKRTIRKIYVPSANSGYPVWRSMQDEASIVALTNGQGNQNPANAIPDNFWKEFQTKDFAGVVTVNWFGLNVDVEVQNWLPAGYCLVLTDQPSTLMWDRLSLATGQDHNGTLEVPINGFDSRRSEARQIATARPDFCLLNFLVYKIA